MFRRQSTSGTGDATVTGSIVSKWSAARPYVLAAILIIFTALYFYLGRHLINQTNSDRNRSDQQNNIRLALEAKAFASPDFSSGVSQALWDWFPHHGDGVVNPLWPWVAARIHRDNDSEEEFFVRGKWLNLGLTLSVLLIGAGFISRRFSLPATLNLLLLTGLGAFLPRAVWFQPEPLYFMLFLAAWTCAIATLAKNSLWRYTLFGILTGLAYLTKSSALPLMLAFLGISTLRFLVRWITDRIRNHHSQNSPHWNSHSHIVGSLLCILAFLMTAGPQLNSSYKRFGNIFGNYPGYWMWLDNFEPQGIDFLLNYNTREKLGAIAEDEKPSLPVYLKTHSIDHATERLMQGIKGTTGDFLLPKRAKIRKTGPDPWRVLLPSRGFYLLFLAGILTFIWLCGMFYKGRGQPVPERYQPETATIMLFAIGTVIGYLILFSWYRPIGKGDRFMLALYAPVVLSLIWAAESIYRRIEQRNGSRTLFLSYCTAHLTLSSMILWRIYELANHPVFFTK